MQNISCLNLPVADVQTQKSTDNMNTQHCRPNTPQTVCMHTESRADKAGPRVDLGVKSPGSPPGANPISVKSYQYSPHRDGSSHTWTDNVASPCQPRAPLPPPSSVFLPVSTPSGYTMNALNLSLFFGRLAKAAVLWSAASRCVNNGVRVNASRGTAGQARARLWGSGLDWRD